MDSSCIQCGMHSYEKHSSAESYAEHIYASMQHWGASVGADDRGPAEESAATSCQVRAICSRLAMGLMAEGVAHFWHVRMNGAQRWGCH